MQRRKKTRYLKKDKDTPQRISRVLGLLLHLPKVQEQGDIFQPSTKKGTLVHYLRYHGSLTVMGIIDVPCANQECDSEDIELISSENKQIAGIDGFVHRFICNHCSTKFSLFTAVLDDTQIPENC